MEAQEILGKVTKKLRDLRFHGGEDLSHGCLGCDNI